MLNAPVSVVASHLNNTLSPSRSSAAINVRWIIDMADKSYRARVHSYITSRTYFESLLKEGAITQEEFNEINNDLLSKYGLEKKSVFNAE